jgi:hypothetical protein
MSELSVKYFTQRLQVLTDWTSFRLRQKQLEVGRKQTLKDLGFSRFPQQPSETVETTGPLLVHRPSNLRVGPSPD